MRVVNYGDVCSKLPQPFHQKLITCGKLLYYKENTLLSQIISWAVKATGIKIDFHTVP
jgi:hypothetical protein